MLRLLGILALVNMINGDNRHRRNGSILGGLFILPVLMFGGWIAIAVMGGILGLAGSLIGGMFSGMAALAFMAAFSSRMRSILMNSHDDTGAVHGSVSVMI